MCDEKYKAQASLDSCDIKAGQIFRSYKGGLYTVVALAFKEDTHEPLVVYQSNAKGTIWARALGSWLECVQQPILRRSVPRFSREPD